MVQAASASKNIWVAASDGDLDRVRVSPTSTTSSHDTPATIFQYGDQSQITKKGS
jgi:hypothetical protein